jgi:hypothetical protein
LGIFLIPQLARTKKYQPGIVGDIPHSSISWNKKNDQPGIVGDIPHSSVS